jgi:hypothetical protein
MDIPKLTASITPHASNAPVATLPNNAYGKTNPTMSNVFCARATTQRTRKAAQTYRRDPSHRFDGDKKAITTTTTRNHIPTPPLLCYCSQIPTHYIPLCWPTTRTPNTASNTATITTNCHRRTTTHDERTHGANGHNVKSRHNTPLQTTLNQWWANYGPRARPPPERFYPARDMIPNLTN